MGLTANAGKTLPLVGEFVGPRTLLNDGTTRHTLTLRLVNTSLDPIQFIRPPEGQPTQSYIEVALPVSDSADDAIWALNERDDWESVGATLSGSAASEWTVTPSTTTPGVFELRPKAKVKNIPPQGVLTLVLTDVTSSLEPGFVQVQVSLKRFAHYGTQTFGVALEKTPLVYNNGSGSSMTLSAGTLGSNNALKVLGDSSKKALMHIEQRGLGPALKISDSEARLSFDVQGATKIEKPADTLGVFRKAEITLDVQGATKIETPAGTLPLMVRSDKKEGAAAEIMIANYGGYRGAESTLSFRTYPPQTTDAASTSAIVAQDDGNYSNHLLFQTKNPGAHTNPLETRVTITSGGVFGNRYIGTIATTGCEWQR